MINVFAGWFRTLSFEHQIEITFLLFVSLDILVYWILYAIEKLISRVRLSITRKRISNIAKQNRREMRKIRKAIYEAQNNELNEVWEKVKNDNGK